MVDKDGSSTYSITKQIALTNKQLAINIFPTLATSQVNIEYATTKNETINIKIVDITGKLIDAKNVNAIVGNNKFYYDCSKLHTGNYFMIFSTKNELMKTKQFSKF
ncbi:MAG: T9SS type A sorting domain-containing protein [Dolichospermum sp.]